MAPDILGVLLIGLLSATATLFWLRAREQEHERRIRQRLRGIRHLTAVVRTYLAAQRGAV